MGIFGRQRVVDGCAAAAKSASARRFSSSSAFIAALVLLGLLTACTPALNWRDVRPEGTALQLQMPCRPNMQARTVTLVGQPVRMQLLACDADGHTWALATAAVAESAAVAPTLQALREAALANVGATPAATAAAASQPMRVPGATSQAAAGQFSAQGRLPDGQAVQLQLVLFADGLQVHQATVLGPQAFAESAQTFFDSLRIAR